MEGDRTNGQVKDQSRLLAPDGLPTRKMLNKRLASKLFEAPCIWSLLQQSNLHLN